MEVPKRNRPSAFKVFKGREGRAALDHYATAAAIAAYLVLVSNQDPVGLIVGAALTSVSLALFL